MVPGLHTARSVSPLPRPVLFGAALLAALGGVNSPARGESLAAAQVWISDVQVTEGDAGTTRFSAEVRLPVWFEPVPVEIVATAETASAGDFSFVTTRLTLVPNGPAQTVSGVVVGDLDFEGDEVFTLRATKAGGTSPYFVYTSGGRVTIVDDDSARASRLSVDRVITVREGDQGTTQVDLTVRLEPASAKVVTVDYRTRDATAHTLDRDYRSAAGTLTFAPGEVSRTITLAIIGDRAWEADERFELDLSAAREALIVAGHADVNITNDDPPARATVQDIQVIEGNGGTKTAVLDIRFDNPVPPQVKMHIAPVGGSARLGEDYLWKFEVLYLKAGDTSATFAVTIAGDTTPECDEGILFEYIAFYAGDETRKRTKVLIQDDDGGPRGPTACPDPFAPGDVPVPPPPDAGPPPPSPPPPDAGAGPPADGAPPTAAPDPARRSGCAIGGGAAEGLSILLMAAMVALTLAIRPRRRRPWRS